MLNRILIFLVIIASAYAQHSQRKALVNLAKTLSEKLQTTLVQTSSRIDNLTEQYQKLSHAFESLEDRVGDSDSTTDTLDVRILRLEDKTLELEDRRALDLTVWNFNKQVCNASLVELRRDLIEKIQKVNSSIPNAGLVQLPDTTSTQTSSNDKSRNSGALDLLNELNDFLDEYEYEDYSNSDSSQSVGGQKSDKLEDKPVNSVDTLVDQTNKLLLDIHVDYRQMEDKVTKIEKETESLKKKVSDTKIKDDLSRDLKRLQDDTSSKILRLQDDIQHGQDDVRNEIKLKMEDIELLRKMTDSRLSVFERRIDLVHEMVANMSITNNQILANQMQSQNFLSEDEDSDSTSPTSTTEREVPDPPQYSMDDELADLANILQSPGMYNPPNTDHPPPSVPSSSQRSRSALRSRSHSLDRDGSTAYPSVPVPPSRRQNTPTDNDHQQIPKPVPANPGWSRNPPETNYPQRSAPRSDGMGWHIPNSDVPPMHRPVPAGAAAAAAGSGSDSPRPRNGRKMWDAVPDYNEDEITNSCDCSLMQERLAILESGFENMMTEVENQMSGIQATITTMIRRLQDIENKQMIESKPKPVCVATKEAAGLDGMDSWCRENCSLGKCPSDLCSCPQS